jgi:ABC-type polar amino acid transport system ATPase subunit
MYIMKYLKLYKHFRLLLEKFSTVSLPNKRLILLSGPSASGKTYFAKEINDFVEWVDDKVVVYGEARKGRNHCRTK